MIYKFLEFDKNKTFAAFLLTDPHMVGIEAVIKNRLVYRLVYRFIYTFF